MKTIKSFLALLLLAASIGCTTLTPQEKVSYDLMKNDNVLIEVKKPKTGAWLGVLPGFGAFYAREPLVGIIDLLLWPISIFWDPVVGYEMSKKINYDLSRSSLQREQGKALTGLENQRTMKEINEDEYVTQKREIEQKFDYFTITQ